MVLRIGTKILDNSKLKCSKEVSHMTNKQRESETVGVLMIGFNPVVKEGLQSILTKDQRIKVIGDVPNEVAAIQYIKRARDRGQIVKVVLTETRSGKVDGVQATRLIKAEFPDVAVLVLTENHAAIIAAQAGIVGNPINGAIAVLEAPSEPG